MPIIYHKKTEDTEIVLWAISETLEDLKQIVNEEDNVSSERFKDILRRKEHLAWRAALRQIIPFAKIVYSDTGAPSIDGLDMHIGVSHTSGMAALIFSPGPCAIDIEFIHRDLGKASRRFVSEEEEPLLDPYCQQDMTLLWCAKEVMYKFSGMKGLNIKNDIKVDFWNKASRLISGTIIGKKKIEMVFFEIKNYLVVHTL